MKDANYVLPPIFDILDKVIAHNIYSKIDFKSAYNLIRFKLGNEYLSPIYTLTGV
jgi:hypothetical protein